MDGGSRLDVISELHIKDYALMDELKVSFEKGLNILTGETGAGKSIIIGALGLALGEKGDPGTIRSGKKAAEVEAVFDLSSDKATSKRLAGVGFKPGPGSLVLRRVVQGTGRTKCFLDGSSTTLGGLKTVSDLLVDIHGQHEHQALFRPETHIDFLDGFAGLEKEGLRFRELFERRSRLAEEIDRTEREARRLRESQELYRFQKREIESAHLSGDEEETLEAERRVLENSERLLLAASDAYERLYEAEGSGSEVMSSVRKLLEEMSEFDSRIAPLHEEAASLADRIDEMARDLDTYRSKIQHDPERLEEVRARIDVIRTLKKKYGGSVASVLEYEKHVETELSRLERSSADASSLKEEEKRVLKEMSEVAGVLSDGRKKRAGELEREVLRELKDLGMEKCKFKVGIANSESEAGPVMLGGKRYAATESGIDQVEFLLSANPGESVKPLAKIASGGEASRVMLALKSILSDVDPVATLIFDEIDIGIGGRVAEAVGRKLKSVSKSRQVICITHLPQIAVYGNSHYAVTKEVKGKKTFTSIEALDSETRVKEIARMLGGKKITDTTVKAAQEMLKNAG